MLSKGFSPRARRPTILDPILAPQPSARSPWRSYGVGQDVVGLWLRYAKAMR